MIFAPLSLGKAQFFLQNPLIFCHQTGLTASPELSQTEWNDGFCKSKAFIMKRRVQKANVKMTSYIVTWTTVSWLDSSLNVWAELSANKALEWETTLRWTACGPVQRWTHLLVSSSCWIFLCSSRLLALHTDILQKYKTFQRTIERCSLTSSPVVVHTTHTILCYCLQGSSWITTYNDGPNLISSKCWANFSSPVSRNHKTFKNHRNSEQNQCAKTRIW